MSYAFSPPCNTIHTVHFFPSAQKTRAAVLPAFSPSTKCCRRTVDTSLLKHSCIDKENGKTSFLARPSGTLQMILEAAYSRSSRRACRRCRFHLKGLRPLHASPGLVIGFVDILNAGSCSARVFCMPAAPAWGAADCLETITRPERSSCRRCSRNRRTGNG